MPNIASVLAIETNPNAIIPCVKVNRALWIAASQYSSPFTVDLRFTYQSGGRTVGPVTSTQNLGDFTLDRVIDSQSVDVHASAVTIPSPVDAGSTVSCSAKASIRDSDGSKIDVAPAEDSRVVAP